MKFCRLIFCGVLLLLAVGAQANQQARNVNLVKEAQQFPRSQKVAVVVGVNKYSRSSGLRSLKYAVADAQLLTRALQRHGYIVKTLTDSNATRGDILNMIEQVGKTLPRNQGTLAFFFSGHGFAEGNKNYLAAFGTIAGRLNSTALSLDEVEREIRKTGVRRAVMFVDACRELPRADGAKTARPLSFIQQHSEGMKALYSTKFGELSYETPQLGHGVFSHFLYRGMSGHAVEQDGVISFDSLKRYVQRETANWTLRYLDKTQKPFTRERGDNFGVFVLGQIGNVPNIPRQPQREPVPKTQATSVVSRPNPPVSVARKPFEPKMVDIPAGSFMMGCIAGRDDSVEGGCHNHNNEKPAHRVQVPAFKLARYEVTFDEWDACERAKACPHADDEGWGRGRRPVINVNWNDAQKYLRWLSQQTGKTYRLPTEAEWEYAARGGGNRNNAYSWGNRIACRNANYGYPMDGNPCENDRTKPVGSYAANGFGLKDMYGNVVEWGQDCYKNNYTGIPVNGTANNACGAYAPRVFRGGSWSDGPGNLRSAFRGFDNPSIRYNHVGFRAARTR